MMRKILLISFMLLSAVFSDAWAQERPVSGKVTDTGGGGLPGVNILLEGTATGVTSDLDGNWKMSIPKDGGKLIFSFIGMATQGIEIGARSVIDIVLKLDAKQLSEVVVTGYNMLKRSDLTSSIVEVDASKIQAQPIGNISNLLQGNAAGVLVTSQNGRPGGDAYIRIRGIGSVNASNEPLFIVDGVQMNSNAYNALNPNDIEGITILKDAASTSIYGARAANGVVLITTKTGASLKNDFEISYKFQHGRKEFVPLNFEMMNKEEKIQYELDLNHITEEIAEKRRTDTDSPETDWQDVLFRTGVVETHNLSLSGNSGNANYFASVGYYNEEGISKGSSFERYSARLNSSMKINNWLVLGNKLSFSQTDDRALRDRSNVQNPFAAAFTYNPYESEYQLYGKEQAETEGKTPGDFILDENGEKQYNLTHSGFSISEAIVNNPTKITRTDIIGNFTATITPVENLSIVSKFGASAQLRNRDYYVQPGSILDGYVGDPNARGSKTDNKDDRILSNWTNTAQYSRSINSVHNISALIGTEYIKYQLKTSRLAGKGFASSKLSTQDNAAEITGGSTTKSEYALWSQFGQLNYNFDSRYVFSASLRRDGSSKFGAENKNGFFWAGSVAWNLTEESFFNFDFMDQLKLRASLGTSGNVPGNARNQRNYASAGLVSYDKYNDATSSFPSQLANDELKWETTRSLSIGVDFGVFNNRVSGALDYYQRKTSDLLFNRPLSETVGFSSRLENVGEMTNKGFELELNADIIRATQYRGFNLNVFGSFSTVKNSVGNLSNGGEDIINEDSGVTFLREGEEANTYFLVKYAGVNPENGEALYYDKEGEKTNKYSADDAVSLDGKSTLPSYFGNLGLSASYKGLSVSANLYFQGGNYIYNYSYEATLLSDGASVGDAQRRDALNYWKNPGDVNVLPRADKSNTINASDRYLQKGDFVRLRNVMVSYSLPKGIVSKGKMKDVTVYVQGTNLWTLNRYFSGDPEIGIGSGDANLTLSGEYNLFSYPTSRGFTLGVNVTF